jgi:hypothetical protein
MDLPFVAGALHLHSFIGSLWLLLNSLSRVTVYNLESDRLELISMDPL